MLYVYEWILGWQQHEFTYVSLAHSCWNHFYLKILFSSFQIFILTPNIFVSQFLKFTWFSVSPSFYADSIKKKLKWNVFFHARSLSFNFSYLEIIYMLYLMNLQANYALLSSLLLQIENYGEYNWIQFYHPSFLLISLVISSL